MEQYTENILIDVKHNVEKLVIFYHCRVDSKPARIMSKGHTLKEAHCLDRLLSEAHSRPQMERLN